MMSTTVLILTVALCFTMQGLSAARDSSCGLGQFRQNGTCRDCQPGTYQDRRGATRCKPCLPGTYNPYRGAQGIDICIECPEGTFQNRSRATSRRDCTRCPPGTNSAPGSPICISCPAGQRIENCDQPEYEDDFPRSVRGNCFSCYTFASGYGCELTGTTQPRCKDCPSGTFSGPNDIRCERCPEGSFSRSGSSNCTRSPTQEVQECPPNTRYYAGECERCTGFTVLNQRSGSCRNCKPGYIGNARVGSTRCIPCPPGTFKPSESSRCRQCAPGENSFVTGGQICIPDNTPCPPNYFRNRNGACLRCSRRQRFDRELRKCVDCPRDFVSDGGVDERCTRCPRNMITNDEFSWMEIQCFCKPGFGFVPGSGATRCEKCPAGTAGLGNSYCEECSPYSIAPRRGMERCISCPRGMMQPRSGQRRCNRAPNQVPCPRGALRTDHGCIEPHTNCPPNSTRVSTSLYELPLCNPESCPVGLALIREEDNLTEDRCGVCGVGQRFNPQNSQCEYCNYTQFSRGGLVEECQNCQPGFTPSWGGGECRCQNARRLVNGRCSECPPGTFGLHYIDGCLPCPAGTTSGRGSNYCRNCTAGTFTDEPGQPSCRRCPEGTSSFGVGDTGCVVVGSLQET